MRRRSSMSISKPARLSGRVRARPCPGHPVPSAAAAPATHNRPGETAQPSPTVPHCRLRHPSASPSPVRSRLSESPQVKAAVGEPASRHEGLTARGWRRRPHPKAGRPHMRRYI
jgi:hypothetical protein